MSKSKIILITGASHVGKTALAQRLLEKYGHPTAEALVESAFEHLELLEKFGFYDTVISVKSSNVRNMIFTMYANPLKNKLKALNAE